MTKRAIVVGGGQIGCAAAAAFARAGWRVAILARSFPVVSLAADLEVEHLRLDRDDDTAFRKSLADGVDFLLDSIAYTSDHARQLADASGLFGALGVISTGSVYADSEGRGLEGAAERGFPQFSGSIAEDQATVEPGPATYSSRKRAIELLLLEQASCPLAVLRPAAVYGIGSRGPREWWFVKRLLDGRPRIPLLYEGRSRFHPSSVDNIAALALTVAEGARSGIFNAVDPAAPDVAEIGRLIMAAMGRNAELIPMPISTDRPQVGRTPWSVPFTLVFSEQAARDVGYRPVTDFAAGVRPVIDWLCSRGEADWRVAFPVLAGYPWELFDYAAEDAALGKRG